MISDISGKKYIYIYIYNRPIRKKKSQGIPLVVKIWQMHRHHGGRGVIGSQLSLGED